MPFVVRHEPVQQGSWKDYFAKTKDRGPRPLLLRAVPHVTRRDEALDLGAGALNDTRHLLQEGFKHVTAVDRGVVAIPRTLPRSRFTYTRASFEDYRFPENTFDIVTAQFSLPFIRPAHFKAIFAKMKGSLVVGGIFTGQLFGERDEWNNSSRNMTFLAKRTIDGLLADMEVIELAEEEKDFPTVGSKQPKHWHLFHIIAKRNSS
jgi:tellurite methyltransferase